MTHHLTRDAIKVALKRARYADKERWLFCISDHDMGLLADACGGVWSNDCACCIDRGGKYEDRCGCDCHKRIDRLAERMADLLLGEERE